MFKTEKMFDSNIIAEKEDLNIWIKRVQLVSVNQCITINAEACLSKDAGFHS